MKKSLFQQMWEWGEWKDVPCGTHIVMYNQDGEFIIDCLIPKKWYDRFFSIGQKRIDQAIEKMLTRGNFKIGVGK